MSKRHQSSRRRTYGRRQHELHELHERVIGTPRLAAREVDLPGPGDRWEAQALVRGVRRRPWSRLAGPRLMAVYEGARPRSPFLPAGAWRPHLLRPQAPALPRRRPRGDCVPHRRRPRFFGMAIGVIVVALSAELLLARPDGSSLGFRLRHGTAQRRVRAAPEPASAGPARTSTGSIANPPFAARRSPTAFPSCRAPIVIPAR